MVVWRRLLRTPVASAAEFHGTLVDSHRNLLITAEEWQAFTDDFNQTLDKFGVPQQERAELFAIIESTRDDIVVAPRPEPDTTPVPEHALKPAGST